MRGLYLITNDDPLNILLQKLAVALATRKIAILQYRRKKIAPIDQLDEVAKIKILCEEFSVPLVINDDIDLAEKYALGVHLGQSDGEISQAKTRLAANAIIGRTCLNSLDLAQKAIAEGATYVAFGAIYATSTKPEAGCIGLDVLQQASQQFDVPICAIGGLTVENADVVIKAGADLCAVISDILSLNLEDIPKRINAWANLFV
ncbi:MULTISPECIES: thiamine phosphate synthase [unclassified Acinetobacter]|uniref:thiamine phosphate synthase n=1 Tax=unclassified Acinetobacter TaxID=196816 RepID=UPI002934BF3B|nr:MULTISPECIES: thiamine phosphate synthase [unclassified Acinetobacter]WOE32011.1 thiamine phosphate synthase [Acinetobacter sp. SAAs470]WOE37479.1 thiamine phosphate synthase [Acinetobacter sp. SAAs474]